MKIKFFLIFICILNLISCSFKKESVLIGERIYVDDYEFTNIIEEYSDESYNDAFFVSDFYIKNFYDQLNKEAIDLKSNKNISSLLTNAFKVVINIGNYEFLRFVNYEYGMFEYNPSDIKENVELFGEYFALMLDSVISYNQNIVVISPFPYLILNHDINSIYLKIIESYIAMIDVICDEYEVKNIKTIKLQKYLVRNKVLNKIGAEQLVKMVYDD